MPERKVSILIQAKDAATRALRGVRSSFESIKRAARGVVIGLGAIAAAAAGAVAALAKMALRGGQVANVERAFARVTGNATQAVEQLRRATNGLISNYDLMVGFNRALTLGSAENIEQFGELARTALTLGRALGVDAAFALESLSLGIGRQSRLILDNLGLIVSVEQANKKYAESLGVTVKELTDAQRREAFRTAALEAARAKTAELGGIQETAADAVGRATTALANFRDAITKLVATSPLVTAFFERLAELADNIALIAASGNVEAIRQAFELLGRIAGRAFVAGIVKGALAVQKALRDAILPGKLAERIGDIFGKLAGGAIMEAIGDIAVQSIDPLIEELNTLLEGLRAAQRPGGGVAIGAVTGAGLAIPQPTRPGAGPQLVSGFLGLTPGGKAVPVAMDELTDSLGGLHDIVDENATQLSGFALGLKNIANTMANQFAGAVTGAIFGLQSLSDALRSLAQFIIREVVGSAVRSVIGALLPFPSIGSASIAPAGGVRLQIDADAAQAAALDAGIFASGPQAQQFLIAALRQARFSGFNG